MRRQSPKWTKLCRPAIMPGKQRCNFKQLHACNKTESNLKGVWGCFFFFPEIHKTDFATVEEWIYWERLRLHSMDNNGRTPTWQKSCWRVFPAPSHWQLRSMNGSKLWPQPGPPCLPQSPGAGARLPLGGVQQLGAGVLTGFVLYAPQPTRNGAHGLHLLFRHMQRFVTQGQSKLAEISWHQWNDANLHTEAIFLSYFLLYTTYKDWNFLQTLSA